MLRLLMALFITTAMAHVQLYAAPVCKTETGNYTVKQGGKTLSCTSRETCSDTKLVCEPVGNKIQCGNKTTTTSGLNPTSGALGLRRR